MKKFFLVYALIIVLALTATACSKTSQQTDETKTQDAISATDTSNNQTDSEESQNITQDEDQEGENEAKSEASKDSNEDASSSKSVDLSLTGQALINSLGNVKKPDKFYVETVSAFADGTTATTKSYYYNDNFRNENDSESGLQIMIYNSDLGQTFTYNDSTKTGMIMSDDMDDDDEYSEEIDMSYDEEELTDEDVELLTAEVQDLNGEQVIYSVIKTGSEGYEYEVHTYYSIKYGVPVKGETMLNGELMTSYEVTKLTDDIKIDEGMFDKPEGVTFMDFDSFGNY